MFENTLGVTSLRNVHRGRNYNIHGVGPLDLGESKISCQIKQRVNHDCQISWMGDQWWGSIEEVRKEIKA
jgi:hypothetical protein